MNPRPPGYEPDELPDCSTPRYMAALSESATTIAHEPTEVKGFFRPPVGAGGGPAPPGRTNRKRTARARMKTGTGPTLLCRAEKRSILFPKETDPCRNTRPRGASAADIPTIGRKGGGEACGLCASSCSGMRKKPTAPTRIFLAGHAGELGPPACGQPEVVRADDEHPGGKARHDGARPGRRPKSEGGPAHDRFPAAGAGHLSGLPHAQQGLDHDRAGRERTARGDRVSDRHELRADGHTAAAGGAAGCGIRSGSSRPIPGITTSRPRSARARTACSSGKQSNRIAVGDTVYLYLAAPVSAIRYRCRAIETDIPFEFSDGNVRMRRVMRLQLLARYDGTPVSFAMLREYGVNAVRGPRGMPPR